MEVVAAGADAGGGGGGAGPAPFARRDVREWSRLDSATGAREHARVESDRWSSRSAAGARSYGKQFSASLPRGGDATECEKGGGAALQTEWTSPDASRAAPPPAVSGSGVVPTGLLASPRQRHFVTARAGLARRSSAPCIPTAFEAAVSASCMHSSYTQSVLQQYALKPGSPSNSFVILHDFPCTSVYEESHPVCRFPPDTTCSPFRTPSPSALRVLLLAARRLNC
ncbi:Uncharacterized protein GBIM_07184 [Gryllus bimaculatus]|nr:Uncharacterized protein GBIM_07184 [Gryllus bimaculatus]